ncbi:MAG: bifunctional adenosylcobinamide kinase/adenosylcobinamide-phosphate guanylyltransferase [Chloroflexi bacterium RBG_13_52_14]|nr:MAG: bifunctional adenosylcobinamide kinase/adenosylcobinamide-phosphate guanylyltransferase [Chloroflexi bacterium RBG_13_52_14]
MSIALILGGARSGKSRFAQELAAKPGRKVLFVATGEPLDEEMRARIDTHKKLRPANWRTLEAPTNVARAMRGKIGDADVVIIDCITLLVSNLMGDENTDVSIWEKRVSAEIKSLIVLLKNSKANSIIVSNEVGLGLVPAVPVGRAYRDILGMANQMLARNADEVYLMIAGIPVVLKRAHSK